MHLLPNHSLGSLPPSCGINGSGRSDCRNSDGRRSQNQGHGTEQIDRSPFRISMFGMGNEHEMPRHYFDVRDANKLAIDDEGMELPTLEAVPEEAAKSLVNTATEHAVWTKAETLAGHRTSIEVRYGNGALPQHSRLNDQDNKP